MADFKITKEDWQEAKQDIKDIKHILSTELPNLKIKIYTACGILTILIALAMKSI